MLNKLIPSLAVSDIQRSITYYREAFGFTVCESHKPGGQLVWACLRSGSTFLMLQQEGGGHGEARDIASTPKTFCIYLQPDDIDALHAQLVGKKLAVGPLKTTPLGARECTLSDPDGYEWWISQPGGGPLAG
jgi:uncharacterized glyoxalase superfamily protein PhnB